MKLKLCILLAGLGALALGLAALHPAAPLPSPAEPDAPSETQGALTAGLPLPTPSLGLPQAPGPRQEPPGPRWEVCWQDSFETAESVKRYFPFDRGEVRWLEKHQALWLDAGRGEQVYAIVRRSLPGDLRVRFRALRRKSRTEVNVGLLVSVRGSLKEEEGYFAEWELGKALIKKRNILQKEAPAATPPTADRWVRLELRRIGAAISMYMEGKIVLEWTDGDPCLGSMHDLFSFYVYADQTLIDDLVIERNAADPTAPNATDPATEENVLGLRIR